MTRQWITMGILAFLLTGCSHNSPADSRSSWYQANKQWVYSPVETNSRLMNRAIWIGTFREFRREGASNGYVAIVDPKAVERLHPCDAPRKLMIAVTRTSFEQLQPQPGETWIIAASQTDAGTKEGYWSLESAAAIPAASNVSTPHDAVLAIQTVPPTSQPTTELTFDALAFYNITRPLRIVATLRGAESTYASAPAGFFSGKDDKAVFVGFIRDLQNDKVVLVASIDLLNQPLADIPAASKVSIPRDAVQSIQRIRSTTQPTSELTFDTLAFHTFARLFRIVATVHGAERTYASAPAGFFSGKDDRAIFVGFIRDLQNDRVVLVASVAARLLEQTYVLSYRPLPISPDLAGQPTRLGVLPCPG